MSLEFTKLSEVAVAESISENASVLVEDGGEVKRTPYSWNTLNGRPFGESPTGGDTLTWDGNTEGLVSATVEVEGTTEEMAYKVSNSVVTLDDLKNGANIRLSLNGEVVNEFAVTYEQAKQNFEEVGPAIQWLLFAPEDNFEFRMDEDLFTCPTAGVYHISPIFTGGSICEITIPGYTGFPSVKQIESKYIPPLTQEQLPAGYPWSEQTVIEFDGNTEGHETLVDEEGNNIVFLSSQTPSQEELVGATVGIVYNNAIALTHTLTAESFEPINDSVYMVLVDYFFCYVVMAPTTLGALTFDKPGIYFKQMIIDGDVFGSILTYGTTTPISESLLPESVKRVVVNVTMDENKTPVSADKTFSEIVALAEAGTDVVVLADGIYHYLIVHIPGERIEFSAILPDAMYIAFNVITFAADGSLSGNAFLAIGAQ